MARTGRPRKSDRVLTRNVGVSIPVPDAELFQDMCEQVGTTGADILRPVIYDFIKQHQHDAEATQEDALPLTG